MRHTVRGRRAGRGRDGRLQNQHHGDIDLKLLSVWLGLSLLHEKLSAGHGSCSQRRANVRRRQTDGMI